MSTSDCGFKFNRDLCCDCNDDLFSLLCVLKLCELTLISCNGMSKARYCCILI